LAKPLRHLLPAARAKYWRHLGAHWARVESVSLENVQHIHAGWASHPAYIVQGVAEALGVPWSFSAHARDIWVEGDDLKAKLASAKFAACCTRLGAEHLKSQASATAGKVLYAPHGIEIENYEYRERDVPSPPVQVLAVGRLVEKKGFEILLRAVALLRAEYSMRLTIIGDGVERGKLKQLSTQLQLRDAVSFPGACPHEVAIAAMQNADLLVAPSVQAADGDRDGLPNVLLEAAACGLPIVSTRIGAVSDFLDESCALMCDAGDVNTLAAALAEAMRDCKGNMQRARTARARVEKDFAIERNVGVLAHAFAGEL
jgi:glycosyltransferase involved in cell wall biosynthesis